MCTWHSPKQHFRLIPWTQHHDKLNRFHVTDCKNITEVKYLSRNLHAALYVSCKWTAEVSRKWSGKTPIHTWAQPVRDKLLQQVSAGTVFVEKLHRSVTTIMIITVSVSNLGGLGLSSGKTSLISSTHSICFWGSSVGFLSVSSSQSHSLLPLYCRGFLSAHSVTARQYFTIVIPLHATHIAF